MEEKRYKGKIFKYSDFYGESWEYIVSGVYKITNLLSNKVYIGESVNIRERWLHHVRKSNRYLKDKGRDWSVIVKAIGDDNVYNFVFEVLEEESDPYKMKEIEMDYISYYDSTHKDKGYNIRDGFIGGKSSNSGGINVESIKEHLINSKFTTTEIAEIFGVNKLTVWRINKGVSHKEGSMEYPLRKDIISKQIALGMEDLVYRCVNCKKDGEILRERNVYCKEECYKEYKKSKIKERKVKRKRNRNNKEPKNTYNICRKCKKKTNKKTLEKYNKMCSICRKETNIEEGFLVYGEGDKVYKEELNKQLHRLPFTEVAEIYMVSDNAVRRWCKRFGMPTDAGSYTSEIKREDFSNKIKEIMKDREGRRVGKYDDKGNTIQEYKSVSEAIRLHNNNTSIWKALNGLRETASGYIWKYIE